MKKGLLIALLILVAVVFGVATFLLVREFGWRRVYAKAKSACEIDISSNQTA